MKKLLVILLLLFPVHGASENRDEMIKKIEKTKSISELEQMTKLMKKEIYFKNCKERFYPYDKICFDLYADLSFIQFRIESLKKEQEKKMK